MQDEKVREFAVAFYPRAVIVQTQGQSDTALISISCPGDPAPLKEGWGALLRLEFHDVLAKDDYEMARDDGTVLNIVAFKPSHADMILDFIDSLPHEVGAVVVHCDAGVSRSAAVARFIHERHGGTLRGNDSRANVHILSILREKDRGRHPAWVRSAFETDSRGRP